MSRKNSSEANNRPGIVELWKTTSETVEPLKAPVMLLAAAVIVVYSRLFWAGFVAYDDDIHVYANPFLNPLSLQSIGQIWQHAYQGLYIPLAYSILAGVSLFAHVPAEMLGSIGQAVTLSPTEFHVTSIGFHAANALLCFFLALRLTSSRSAALICALVFALHPLQVESVGWISELRGLTSACFGLVALNLFVFSRRLGKKTPTTTRNLLAVSSVFVICAMLCKPAAVALPLVALVIDRVALRTPWRKSMGNALIWGSCIVPFALMTRSVQVIHPQGVSLWWQRPFVAGEALTFYLSKIVAPVNLCVEYGHTPRSAMSHAWSYVAWTVPLGLLVFCFINRQRRPIAWLGSLIFLTFFIPVLGLLPFSFQAHSTVADRYAYLPLIGLGLVVADAVTAVPSNVAMRAASAVIIVLAIVSFNQSTHWLDNTEFLQHTIDVNPNVAFAHNNLGNILLKHDRVDEAIEHFNKTVELDPGNAMAHNNLGLALVKLGRLGEAEPHYRKAVELDPRYFKAYENLAAVYLQSERFGDAIAAIKGALAIQPMEAKALNDLGVAYMQTGHAAEGLDAFERAVRIEPNNARYRKNLGYALLQQGRQQEAAAYLNP